MSSAKGVGDRNRKLLTAGQEIVNLIFFLVQSPSCSFKSSNAGQVQQTARVG